MEVKVSLQNLIEAYEHTYGPLSSKYPFEYSLDYAHGSSDFSGMKVTLNPDNTFTGIFIVKENSCPGQNHARYEANGKFEFSLEKRELTLLTSELKRYILEQSGNFITEFEQNTEVINKLVESTFREIVVKNFSWVSDTIEIPVILIPESKSDKDYDFSNLTVENAPCFVHELRFSLKIEYLTQLAKFKIEEKPIPSTIDKPIETGQYGKDLILNPDGSLTFYSDSYRSSDEWDDGYSCELKCTGKWVYDLQSRSINLIFDNFCYKEDGKVLNFEVPSDVREIVTNEFIFGTKYINSLHVVWIGKRIDKIYKAFTFIKNNN